MANKDTTKYEKLVMIAHGIRKFEIGLLWRRAWLFWGFTLTGFIGFGYFFNNLDYEKALLVANFGFISSFIWTLANRGSKFWQDSWDRQIWSKEGGLELKAFGYGLLDKIIEPKTKGLWLSGVRFSPSKLMIALSDYVTASWFFILIGQGVVIIGGLPDKSVMKYISFIATIITLIYARIVFIKTQKHYL